MKRLGNCWAKICSDDNLYAAWRLARKGKSRRQSVCRIALDLEQNLATLQQQLQCCQWVPGAYRQFTIYERKPRLISAAPIRDRVVHHAIMRVIELALDRQFIYDSYAWRRGKGVHAAVNRYQYYAQRYAYCLKLDNSRYFPSIDHTILKAQLARHIKCAPTLLNLALIIDHSPPVNVPRAVFPGDDLLTPLDVPAFQSAI